MKKKLSILLFLVGLVYSFFLFSTNSTTDGPPLTAISKTITKDYASEADVLAEVHYTEYIDGKWYSGTPKLTGEVQELSHGWRATYTGKINY
jgi:hypothetical protein